MKYDMTKEKLEKIAKEYLEQDIPIKDLASKYDIGKSSLIAYFKGEKKITLSSEMQKQIDARKNQRWKESKATNGNRGSYIFTDAELIQMANTYVSEEDLSLRDIAAAEDVSPTTIYNNFTQEILGYELYEQVNEKYEFNRKNATSKIGRK